MVGQQRRWEKSRKKSAWGFFIWHSLMIATMLLIFHFSAQGGAESRNISNGVLAWILHSFSWFLPEVIVDWLTMWIRKVAHYLIYLTLGMTASGAYYCSPGQRVAGKGMPGVCLMGLATAAVYACTDEFHQLFVPERSGQFTDVLLDSAGAMLGVLLFAAGILLLKRHAEKRKA